MPFRLASLYACVKKERKPRKVSFGVDNRLLPMPERRASKVLYVDNSAEVDSGIRKVIDKLDHNGSDDPFYVIDLSELERKFQEWESHMPRIRPYYAMKCNSHEAVLRTLTSLGCGLDVATKGEMKRAVSHSVPNDRLIYSNTSKAISGLHYARKIGLDLTVFDSEMELIKIKKHFPEMRLLVRLAYDDPGALISMSQRFGCSVQEATRLVDIAIALGLNVVGVCFHVGCGSRDPMSYCKAIEEASKIFEYSRSRGRKMTILDIGGGFPGNMGNIDAPFSVYADAINDALDRWFPSSSNVNVLAEPGQYFVASCQSVFVSIIGIKQEPNSKRKAYILSDGIHGSFRDFMTFKLTPNIVIPHWYALDDSRLEECSLWGPTCDPMDVICDSHLLPPLAVGQWLEFKLMGAYTNELFCNFNGIPKPDAYVMATSDNARLIN